MNNIQIASLSIPGGRQSLSLFSFCAPHSDTFITQSAPSTTGSPPAIPGYSTCALTFLSLLLFHSFSSGCFSPLICSLPELSHWSGGVEGAALRWGGRSLAEVCMHRRLEKLEWKGLNKWEDGSRITGHPLLLADHVFLQIKHCAGLSRTFFWSLKISFY